MKRMSFKVPKAVVPDAPLAEDPTLDADLKELERRTCVKDACHFIDTYGKVQADTGAGIVPFRLYDYQRDLLGAFAAHTQVIVLKARQLGITELVAAYAVWMCLRPYQTVVAISQGRLEAGELVNRARICFDNLPRWLRPDLVNENRKSSLVFANGSRIEPKPATKRAGRSATAHLLILDEWAQQEFADEIFAAASPTASSAGNRIIGISTAQGVGNMFHTQWELALQGMGMHPVFLPWDSRPGRDDAWYRQTTRNLPDWLREQEYPSNADEAFILSGRPVFDTKAIAELMATTVEPLETVKMGDGFLRVWERPIYGRRYVCGADTAEGLAKGDYSAAVLLDFEDGTEVAELHGHWPPELFAGHLSTLCRKYFNPLLAVERNNHGHAVLLALQSIEHYAPLYRHAEYDRITHQTFHGPLGWATTSKSKPIMIDTLGTAIRERRRFRNAFFLAEARTYALKDDGDMGASGQGHDDRVIALAIAEQVRKRRPVSARAAVGGERSQVVPYQPHAGQMRRDPASPALLPNLGRGR